MARISYSELSTFEMCPLMHLYRYHFRLQTRRYDEKRALHVGSMVHNTIESLYKAHQEDPFEDRVIPQDVFERALTHERAKVLAEYAKLENRPYAPSQEEFEVDCALARNLAYMFAYEVFPEEEYELLQSEHRFEVEIGGHTFIGFMDGVMLRKDKKTGIDLVFPGEVKTWSNSRSVTKLKQHVLDDLQTDIYCLALLRDPKFQHLRLGGKLYTVYRKPPSAISNASNFNSVKEHIEAIDSWYGKTKAKKKRVEVPFDLSKVQEVEDRVLAKVAELQQFYEAPYENAVDFERPNPHRFPCNFCEYHDICRRGEKPGADFDYKKGRLKSYK